MLANCFVPVKNEKGFINQILSFAIFEQKSHCAEKLLKGFFWSFSIFTNINNFSSERNSNPRTPPASQTSPPRQEISVNH